MARTTIDFGIDLGTTNSEIACMDKGELVVVKNIVTSSEVTPSAVKIDGKGSVIVGQNAYNELEYDPDNAVGEFKRWMGNSDQDGFTFQKSQRRLTAAQLSAEVLKTLKASASSRFGEEVAAAVITVPAMFLIPACEDTKAASKLAGINVCPLLQEPVAAAIAYGYQAESLSGNLLVFDLGGGTFDTTVLTARDGRLVVVGHDGDDKLGGKDYDWALVGVLVQRLTQEYGDLGLKRDGSARRAMAKLKYLAEDAKKSLTLLNEVAVEVKRLEGKYEHVDTVIQLSRSDFERATEQHTERCISVCRRLLQHVRLSKDDLAAVLIVGGQTKSPYVREMVSSVFGRADFRLDPMTVVASGASLFASTQRIPINNTERAASTGVIALKLAYSPVSTELDADLGIALEKAKTATTVTIARSDGGWSSGAIPVPPSCKLFTTVVLRAKRTNSFEIQVRDVSGATLLSSGSSFSITHGLAVAQATTSKAFGVALEQNESHVIIPKGTPLPAKGTQTFITVREVAAGNPKSTLRIYVLEGDDPRSDRNYGIGLMELKGDELRRSLPAGETVEITYRLDDSKSLSAEAVFPSLREARQMIFRPERPSLTAGEIDLEIRKEKERLEEVERAAPEKVGSHIGRHIVLIEKEKEAAADDPDARQKAAQQLIELKQAVDALQRSSEWELLVAELDGYRDSTKRVVESRGTDDQRRDLPHILRKADAALAQHNIGDLRHVVEQLRDTYWSVAFAQDDFWKAQFAQMWEESEFVDPLKAERLKEEGMRAMKRSDISSLRTIVRDLYNLLPTWQQGKLDMRFGDAGLKRARGQD
jgi:molecular chaperone DnaK